jgi:hypothetical protein
MDARLEALKSVLAKHAPEVRVEAHEVVSAYEPASVHALGIKLLNAYRQDEWSLNNTGGTKLMSSPLEQVFHHHDHRVFYVDTEQARILYVGRDWQVESHPFERGVNVAAYFALFGQRVKFGEPHHWTERTLFAQLRKLNFDDVAPSVRWIGSTEQQAVSTIVAEFDVVATSGYRLYVFERKHLSDPMQDDRIHEHARRGVRAALIGNVRHDLEKLAYTRAVFGGPFGRVYWAFSGNLPLSPDLADRCARLGVTLVRGKELERLAESASSLGLPPPRVHSRANHKDKKKPTPSLVQSRPQKSEQPDK